MTAKRKAEIQRKLSMTVIPRPPSDLADRIKADIPKYLNVEAERERFSHSVGFNLRIAASIIVLVSLAAAMMLLVPDQSRHSELMQAAQPPAPRAKAAAPATGTDEVSVEIVQAAKPAAEPIRLADADAGARPRMRRQDAPQPAPAAIEENEWRVDGVVGTVVGGVEGGSPGGVVGGVIGGETRAEREREFAPEPAAPPASMAPPPPAPAMAESAPARRMSVTASAPSLIPSAYADEISFTPKSVFGISVDPEVFPRIRTTIEKGQRPSPTSSNIEALVNYFAGAPARVVKRGVRLETEASPAPVGSNGHRGILRFTVDTAIVEVSEHGTIPPIATDAHLEIQFHRDSVNGFAMIGDNASSARESALLHNTSVTGLYALDLRTPLKAAQRVATIRLSYRSIADGKKHTIVKDVHGRDFAKLWADASRRHRLASLGALWGESLRNSSSGSDVAKRAEELAAQEPTNTLARELAEVAVASSGGGR